MFCQQTKPRGGVATESADGQTRVATKKTHVPLREFFRFVVNRSDVAKQSRGEVCLKGTHSDGRYTARPFQRYSDISKRYTAPVGSGDRHLVFSFTIIPQREGKYFVTRAKCTVTKSSFDHHLHKSKNMVQYISQSTVLM
jgi:hypothetical protein